MDSGETGVAAFAADSGGSAPVPWSEPEIEEALNSLEQRAKVFSKWQRVVFLLMYAMLIAGLYYYWRLSSFSALAWLPFGLIALLSLIYARTLPYWFSRWRPVPQIPPTLRGSGLAEKLLGGWLRGDAIFDYVPGWLHFLLPPEGRSLSLDLRRVADNLGFYILPPRRVVPGVLPQLLYMAGTAAIAAALHFSQLLPGSLMFGLLLATHIGLHAMSILTWNPLLLHMYLKQHIESAGTAGSLSDSSGNVTGSRLTLLLNAFEQERGKSIPAHSLALLPYVLLGAIGAGILLAMLDPWLLPLALLPLVPLHLLVRHLLIREQEMLKARLRTSTLFLEMLSGSLSGEEARMATPAALRFMHLRAARRPLNSREEQRLLTLMQQIAFDLDWYLSGRGRLLRASWLLFLPTLALVGLMMFGSGLWFRSTMPPLFVAQVFAGLVLCSYLLLALSSRYGGWSTLLLEHLREVSLSADEPPDDPAGAAVSVDKSGATPPGGEPRA